LVVERLGQLAAALREQQPGTIQRIGRLVKRSNSLMQAGFAGNHGGADQTLCRVSLERRTHGGIEFVAGVKNRELLDLLAAEGGPVEWLFGHSSPSSCVRILRVARNSEFFTVSSVVPRTSPIAAQFQALVMLHLEHHSFARRQSIERRGDSPADSRPIRRRSGIRCRAPLLLPVEKISRRGMAMSLKHGFGRLIFGPAVPAAELVQVRIYARFRFRAAARYLDNRVVTNVYLDQLRRRNSRPEDQAPEPVLQAHGHASTGDFFDRQQERGAASDPERRLMGLEIGRRISTALDRLTPRERMVFEMKHYQGLKLRAMVKSLAPRRKR